MNKFTSQLTFMQKKRQIRRPRTQRKQFRWRRGYVVLIMGMVFLSYIFLLGNYGLIKYFQLQRRKSQLINQINQLKQEQAELQKEIDLLQNNYHYIEKIAREKYQMGKADEKIYFMISPDKKVRERK